MTIPSQSTIDTILVKVGEIQTVLAVVDERTKRIDDHENRLRRLERWMYGLPIAALLALAALALDLYVRK